MATEDEPAGFLGRWSRRKAQVREGKPPIDPAPAHPPSVASAAAPGTRPTASPPEAGPDPQAPPPTLAEVQALTAESDFAPFMARDVSAEVKNAAMKKLFTDPHFNVMDRMDVYIDDYGVADPIPLAMLRQMNGAKFLNLFDDEPARADANPVGDPSADVGTQLVAQSESAPPLSPTAPTPHDHVDLRLQPDPAPRSEGAGPKPA